MDKVNRKRLGNEKFAVIVRILVGVCLSAFFVWCLSALYTFIMISPDDVLYEKILSGVMTGSPNAHSYFLRYSISSLIVCLYRAFPTMPWYQVFLVFSAVLSVFFLFERVLSMKNISKVYCAICMFLFVSVICSETLVHFEWTVTAGLLGATGLFRFCTIPSEPNKKRVIYELSVCLLLFVLCFNIRNTVFLLLLPLLVICICYRIIKSWGTKLCAGTYSGRLQRSGLLIRIGNPIILFVLFLLLIVVFTSLQHNFMYSSDEWEKYDVYTRNRSTLFDYSGYPDYDTYSEVYQQSGISKEAYLLMSADYNFIVPCDSFNEMRIDSIASLSHELYDNSFQAKFDYSYNRFLQIVSSERLLFLNFYLVVLGTMCFELTKKENTIDTLYIFALIFVLCGLSVYFSFKGRFPDHVVTCLDFDLVFILLAYLINNWNEKISEGNQHETGKVFSSGKLREVRFHRYIMSVAMLLVLISTAFLNYMQIKKSNDSKVILAKAHFQIVEYCREHPECVFLRDFWSFSQRGELFLNFDYAANNYLVTGGWTYNSPLYHEVLNRWGCEEFIEAVENNSNIYYLVSEARCEAVKERLDSYFHSQDASIEMIEVDSFETSSENVIVLKFQCTN